MQNKWLPRRVSTWRRSPEPPLHLQGPMVGLTCGIPLHVHWIHNSFPCLCGRTLARRSCSSPNQVDLVWVRPHLTLASRSHWANQPRLNFGMLREDPQKREERMKIEAGEEKKKGPPPLRPPLRGPTHTHPTPTHMWPNAVAQMRSNKDDQIKFGGRNRANSCNFTAPSAVNRLRWGVS